MSPKKPKPQDSTPVPLDPGKVRALTRPYDAARYLHTEEQREAYLEAAQETGDPDFWSGGSEPGRGEVAPQKKRYSLSELLRGVNKKSLKAINDQVAPALAGAPVGRELA